MAPAPGTALLSLNLFLVSVFNKLMVWGQDRQVQYNEIGNMSRCLGAMGTGGWVPIWMWCEREGVLKNTKLSPELIS